MATVITRPSATADLIDILDRLTSEAGPSVALKHFKRFDRLYDRLADFPASCPARPVLGRGIRLASVKPYVVLYSYAKTKNLVTIIRIIHGKRLITKRSLSGG